jgi:hypothetical protein
MQTFKILGQADPGAMTNATLYTVPDQAQVVISVLNIANTTGAAVTVRVYAVQKGASPAAATNALAYDLSVAANSVDTTIKKITLRGGDYVVIYSSAAGCTFSLFGSEIS